MAYEIEIDDNTGELIVNVKAVIEVDSPTAEIIDVHENSVDIYSCTHVVVCDDIYIKNYIAEIPEWMETYVANVTEVALAGTNTSLANLQTAFEELETGYSMTIASVSNDISAQNIVIESLVSSTEDALAGMVTTINTKVDETQALALINTRLAAFMDFELTSSSAWWEEIITAVVTEQESQAGQITVINAVSNNASAGVTTVTEALATTDAAVALAAQYVTATVGGTELITGYAMVSEIDPEGNQISQFAIYADKFKIFNSVKDNVFPVFSIDGDDFTFNGKVVFAGLGIDSDSTTIHGGKVTAQTIVSNHIATAGLSAGVIKTGVMYNTGGSAANYTMKIDLDNGEIHIK